MAVVNQKETMGFQTETKKLLQLMVHSLYSNKEIFLRELISNASDAADKLRHLAISKPELLENDPDLKIWVDFNKDEKTLTIRDNGIGMDRDDVINNLGTIARSGTAEFLENISKDPKNNSQLIGQFGVGFYSSFIVADEVTVKTRKAGVDSSEGVIWHSKGEGEFDIETTTKAERGTEITLHLKDSEQDLLNDWHLRHIISKYSDHINFPVVMKKIKEAEKENDAEDSAQGKSDDSAVLIEEETVNKAQALWTQPKNEITVEQYNEFYKNVAHDFEDPMSYAHNKVEGKLEYTTLLYIPQRAPFDMWMANKTRGLKLYVNRVFIMDDSEQFLPNYLRFVRGIVDSNDLPLNVSREILQGNKSVDSMRSAITKRILGMLEDLSKDADKYQKFWQEFGAVLKEGVAEDFVNKELVAKLLRFASTKEQSVDKLCSLDEYISRMPESQEKIYYIAADNFNAAKNSPHLEIFAKQGIEVLIMHERIDEWVMSHLTEYSGKKIQSVAKGNLELKDVEEPQNEELTKELAPTLDKIKTLLDAKIKDARFTQRLTNSPACIVVEENDLTPQMERLMKAAGQKVAAQKPILELNPEHPLVKSLSEESDETRFADLGNILFDQAVLAEGGQVEDPAGFVARLNKILLETKGIPSNE